MNKFNYKMSCNRGIIYINKNDCELIINQTLDGDVWFISNSGNLEMEFDLNSICEEEWKTFEIFEKSMRMIIGKYVLLSDFEKEENFLPYDFISVKNKTIVWHNDSDTDSYLSLEYLKDKIKLSVGSNVNNKKISVRISTSSNDYKSYYMEFIDLYRKLYDLAYQASIDNVLVDNAIVRKRGLHSKK